MHKFDVKPFLEAAEILVAADETERALALLDNLPALQRYNPPQKISNLKKEIMSKITIANDLLGDKREIPKTDEWAKKFLNGTMRGVVLKGIVSDYNLDIKAPYIFDVGPGDFCFALGLQAEKLTFTYSCSTLNKDAEAMVKDRLGSRYWDSSHKIQIFPSIFVAYEIIEHLHNPNEIRQIFDREFMVLPERVLLSTPRFTFAEGTPNWRTDGIHHLRAYTPSEFFVEAGKLFPEYVFTYIDNEVMVLSGKLKE